jgi:hypothetical protein
MKALDSKVLMGAYVALGRSGRKVSDITPAVRLKFYTGKSRSSSRVYAEVWMKGADGLLFRHSTAWAGGYGYHKQSAAAGEAFKRCYVSLDSDIDGRGEGAIRDALEAITKALGFQFVTIVSV